MIAAPTTPEGRVRASLVTPTQLLVLYDEHCAVCRRCRHWLEGEPTYLPLTFVAAGSEKAKASFPELQPWLGVELAVVGDRGQVWIGPAAFLTCLWATRSYRQWAYTLSGPTLVPLAERFFHAVSARRSRLARFVRSDCADGQCRHRR